MPRGQLTRLAFLVDRLGGELRGLRTRFGDCAMVRRVENDIERLIIDLSELRARSSELVPQQRHELVVVPDSPYDPTLWHDADDEGVGGFRAHR